MENSQVIEGSVRLKVLLMFIGIASVLIGCSTSDEWKEELSKFPPSVENSFLSSTSPNLVHTMDLRERSTRHIDKKDKKISYETSSLRIYYGKFDGELEKYKEFEGFDLTTIDYFKVEWQDDSSVLIHVYRVGEDGTRFEDKPLRLDTFNAE